MKVAPEDLRDARPAYPRIVMAIILAERGEPDRARDLLGRQAQDTHIPAHAE